MDCYDALKTQYGCRALIDIALARQLQNVKTFAELSRDNLAFEKRERRLVLHRTANEEEVSIQYPGKESKNGENEKGRPWDFRPKLKLTTGDELKDLTFPDIWDDLASLHIKNDSVLGVLAAIFYRMATMADHAHVQKQTYVYRDYDFKCSARGSEGTIKLSWHKFQPDMNLIAELSKSAPKIRGASIEAYLHYNDLLAQNEDCKYFYRDEIVKNKNWDNKIGRHNTLLSHISVIEYLKGEISFSQIMMRFQRGRGVAPISLNRLEKVTGGIITRR